MSHKKLGKNYKNSSRLLGTLSTLTNFFKIMIKEKSGKITKQKRLANQRGIKG